ncbi:hypothetical protein GlitD10_1084 [Gloeomargarita lithophora Alchichica-D10]|uniref:DUF488 domain-containing protein n=1 Tax=Gloeomargarita lithophora Alchichica-D10 TaxID=1188229 RepID=A0A1J0ABT1_9CYAN|nr:DUF488 domain-containing protein [Gloeomargarita lithophora]APB33404.1 hypothetical protein GlitD10_1084 [Gloeomargarita lithophora Alchichica-D10]
MQPLFTIGHSQHSLESFIVLLQQHNVTALADVRSMPYSRRLPQFNRPVLEKNLPQAEIRYAFLGKELGARPEDSHCYVDGKALYENIAVTSGFSQGINRILKGVRSHRIALMCAEKDPVTCHRAILVCQHLLPFNLEIGHILTDGSLEYHEDLEDRLLKLHDLQDPEPSNQLSLFSEPTGQKSSREERLKEAYHRQGLKIAYVEKEHSVTNHD